MKKLALFLVAGIALPFFVSASTLTCGTSPGAIDFAMNSTWYGHACKISIPDSEDVKTVSADLRRITAGAGDPVAVGIMADSSNKPSGTFLNSATVSPPIDGVCGLRSVTFSATTTLTSGSYWLVAQFSNTPDGNNNIYICDNGGGGYTTSDSNTGTWSTGANGSYHFTYIIASSTGGGGGGGGSSVAPSLGISLGGATTSQITYSPSETIFNGFILTFVAIFILTYLLRN